MPRLNEHISVGFCESYGDGDYQIAAAKVESLSRDRMNELTLAITHAMRHAWEIWLQANVNDQAMAQTNFGIASNITGEQALEAGAFLLKKPD